MFKKLLVLLLNSFIVCSAADFNEQQQHINNERFLISIGEVETGNAHWKVGKHGERSIYQISEGVWKTYTKIPFYYASRKQHQQLANNIANQHLDWIKIQLQKRNINPTPEICAQIWNTGLTNYLKGKISQNTKDYAIRVTNIYNSL